MDILESFGWSYVSLLYSEGSYGTEGFRAIKNSMESRGLCLAVTVKLRKVFKVKNFEVSKSLHFVSLSEYNSTRDIASFREEDRKTGRRESERGKNEESGKHHLCKKVSDT